MRLFLTSDGLKTPELTDAFLELLGKPGGDARVAWIPTPADLEVDKSWLHLHYKELAASGVGHIDIVSISATSMDVWLPTLEQADVIWFEGGDSGYLLHWIRLSGLQKELPRLLESRVYGGISAGSMVAGPDISYRHALFGADESFEPDDLRGLNLTNFAVVPHMHSDFFTKVRPENIAKVAETVPYKLYGITDSNAVEVVDGEVSLIGSGVEIFPANES